MSARQPQPGALRPFLSEPDHISRHLLLIGVSCIKLANSDAVALVDTEDLPLVARYSWRLHQHPDGLQYATTSHYFGGRQFTLQMHRVIAMVGPSTVVDHRSRNGLDNRKDNLRPCTHAQNLWNSKLSRANKFGVKGLRQRGNRWAPRITANGCTYEETFLDRGQAEQWLAGMRKQLHGEFARHA